MTAKILHINNNNNGKTIILHLYKYISYFQQQMYLMPTVLATAMHSVLV